MKTIKQQIPFIFFFIIISSLHSMAQENKIMIENKYYQTPSDRKKSFPSSENEIIYTSKDSPLQEYEELTYYNEEKSTIYYTRHEKWYFQAQSGGNYILAENIRYSSFKQGLSGSYAFSAGKNFSPAVGMRLQILGGGDKGRYYNKEIENSPHYSFHHINGIAEVTINLINLAKNAKRGEESAWNFIVMLGPGVAHTYGFDKKGYEYPNPEKYNMNFDAHTNFLLYGGLEFSYNTSSNLNINLEANNCWMGDSYNGFINGKLIDGSINLMLGIRYTIN